MSINLIDIVKQQLTGGILDKVTSLLGEEKNSINTGLNVVLPSVLGGMANKATDINGAQSLLSALTSGNHDGSIFNSLSSMLGGGSATQGLMNSGSSLINSLFGNKLASIIDFISTHAGIKNSSATSLMSMAAPLLLGSIGKQLGGNASVATLMSLLGSQLSHIQAALPAGASKVLGLNNISLENPLTHSIHDAATRVTSVASNTLHKVEDAASNTLHKAENAASNTLHKVEDEASGLNFNSILPWLLLGLAALLGLYLFRTCNKVPDAPKMETPPVVAPKPDTVKVTVTKKMLKIPGSTDIEVVQGSFLDKLYDEMTDNSLDPKKAIAFDNLNFATGKAEINEESKSQLNDVAKIMLAFPKVEINVAGHTDNVGNAAENLKLSKERAAAVEKYLISKGVPDAHITPIGYGSTMPIGDNATDAGKASNRRTEVYVVKK